MANYPAEVPTEQGLDYTIRTAAASDTVPGGVVVDVRNTNASALTVTIVTPAVVQGDLAVADRVVTVPATTGKRAILIPNNSVYVDQATGLVTLQFSITGATSTFVVYRAVQA